MPARKSHGHGPVLAVLRSPAHRLLSGMAIELRYTGRRSGREFTLPAQHAPDEGGDSGGRTPGGNNPRS
jgi:hypothetical protein